MMLALGIYTLLGGQIHLPMPGRRTGGRAGIAGVYSLGVFSGVASSCCAPVLAGVIALSGVASSFAAALSLGVAYVFGMVTPLVAIALLWDRRDWGSSRLFHPRSFTWRIGPISRTVSGTGLASGVLLLVMGTVTLWIAFTRSSMPSPTGWTAAFSARLQHYGHVITDALSFVPGWVAAPVIVISLTLLTRRALREVRARNPDVIDGKPVGEEDHLEHQQEL